MAARPAQTFDEIIKSNLSSEQLKHFNRIHYGREHHGEITLKQMTLDTGKEHNFDVAAFSFDAPKEVPQDKPPRIVKVGLIQHSVVLPTDAPIADQKDAVFNKVKILIDTAASEGVQIVCLHETWSMPFFLCTREKNEWADFAESPTEGPSIRFLCNLAKKYNLVIVSPILEKEGDTWWNTAVVINESGNYMGKHRKNHLPSVGSFSETDYYSPGNTGHPVFETKYAKIAVNICYGRHQALNWLMFGLNGAEVVFNPAATIAEFGESFWGIEARNAAIANGYFTCSINRVGKEEFKKKDGTEVSRNYYGSSYVTAPNGCKTPALSRIKDGLLIVEMDLNLCHDAKVLSGCNMTARLDMYAKEIGSINLAK